MERQLERYAQLAALVLLIVGCFLVLQPFITAILFAAVICSATWPMFIRLRRRCGGRGWLAALAMSLLQVVLVMLPLALLVLSLADNATTLVEAARRRLEAGPINLPRWIVTLPLAGESIDNYWQRLTGSREELALAAQRLAEPARDFVLAAGRILAGGLLQMSLTALVSFFFYRDGEVLMSTLRSGTARIMGERLGSDVIGMVRNTSDGVVYGLLGTAIAQAVVAAIGFVMADIPAPALLGAATFVLSLVPLGPPLIWGGAAIWLFTEGRNGWGIFMLLYGTLVISSIDNFIKPILISRGSNLPLILVLLGVLGGVVAFGFVGLFMGPVFLAVGYTLAKLWTRDPPPSDL